MIVESGTESGITFYSCPLSLSIERLNEGRTCVHLLRGFFSPVVSLFRTSRSTRAPSTLLFLLRNS